jgi:hypothetical protein
MPVSKKLPHAVDRALSGRLPFGMHGAMALPTVDLLSHSLEFRQDGRFVGDQANTEAFKACLEKQRRSANESARDPFGKTPSAELSNKKLDKILKNGDAQAVALLQSAIDDYACGLIRVIKRYRRTRPWQKVKHIVVGGGFSGHRVGELAVARCQMLLADGGLDISMSTIRNHPDDAGLIGGVQLAPAWVFAGHDAILAVDIGGTNLRCGIVRLRQGKSADLASADVASSLIWRHADDDPKRAETVAGLIEMLEKLVRRAKRGKLKLAPFVAIGCPGRVRFDGLIDRGAQNLPGHWQSAHFNLPMRVRDGVPRIGGHDTVVVMHNDAVVQGLSEAPFMRDAKHWAVLTIGTGLGNASFKNRKG